MEPEQNEVLLAAIANIGDKEEPVEPEKVKEL
jgi:hypothetical protein